MKFETPIVEIEKFEIADVITTSTGCDTDCVGFEPCDSELPGM